MGVRRKGRRWVKHDSKENPSTKFDETIELHVRLGINPRKTEQQVRGTILLPSGMVKKKRIAAFHVIVGFAPAGGIAAAKQP